MLGLLLALGTIAAAPAGAQALAIPALQDVGVTAGVGPLGELFQAATRPASSFAALPPPCLGDPRDVAQGARLDQAFVQRTAFDAPTVVLAAGYAVRGGDVNPNDILNFKRVLATREVVSQSVILGRQNTLSGVALGARVCAPAGALGAADLKHAATLDASQEQERRIAPDVVFAAEALGSLGVVPMRPLGDLLEKVSGTRFGSDPSVSRSLDHAIHTDPEVALHLWTLA